MKARDKNPVLKSLVETLRDKSFKEKKPGVLTGRTGRDTK